MSMKNTQLPPILETARQEIEQHATEYGLDFFPILYEVLDYRTLYETAALGGFPIRYPHWRFGMQYDQLMKGHTWAGSTIYEMVINTNPSYSYLLEGNEMVTQKMVMAHVTAHVDFFKNNMWFAHTNRKMLDEMANHSARIQRIIERHGYDIVEDFIDTCLSLENLIDYHAPYIKRPDAKTIEPIVSEEEETLVEGLVVDREYMRHYINPPDFLEMQRMRLEQERQRQKQFPEYPQKDILLFLLNYAPLERWQHTILEIVRDEAYYFAPQGMTKILNEGWACMVAGSLLMTNRGLIPIEEIVHHHMRVHVSDGQTQQQVYDWTSFAERDTIYLRTQRGFEMEGSANHRIQLPDGSWKQLDALELHDTIRLGSGTNLWATEYVTIDWLPPMQAEEETLLAATSRMATHDGESLPAMSYSLGTSSQEEARAKRIPTMVDETLAKLLGYLMGNTYAINNDTLTVTTPNKEIATAIVKLTRQIFQYTTAPIWQEDRWYISLRYDTIIGILLHLGLPSTSSSATMAVPQAILRSPATVVAAFLNALYQSTSTTDHNGTTLPTTSAILSQHVQLLLLNFGILSTRWLDAQNTWHIHITQTILLSLPHTRHGEIPFLEHLFSSLSMAPCLSGEIPNSETDTIVAIQRGKAPVYDISVTATHCYAAQGFINHNSYWHSHIMTRKVLHASEIISFADLHSGVVATGNGQLNPYKLGIELLRDVEDRWNKGKFGKEYEECDNIAEKQHWDKQLGLGRQKIFEIRKLYNDVTFIDEFLTPEFVMEQKLFTFQYNRDTDMYEIASRQFQEIKEKLLFQLTNFGQPFIYIEDANYNNRGELYLHHRHEGVDLKLNYARDTMRNLYKIWTRPIYLETIIDEKRRLLSYDGRNLSERRME